MDNTQLLQQIGEIIDTKLDEKLAPIQKQLDTVEMKVEVVNKRVENLDKKVENLDKKVENLDKRVDSLDKKVETNTKSLHQAIKDSQEETIETLLEAVNEGYNMHDKRIKRIEDHLQLPPIQ